MQSVVTNNIFIIPTKMTEFIYMHLPSGITTSDCLEKKKYIFSGVRKTSHTTMPSPTTKNPQDYSEPPACLLLLTLPNQLFGLRFSSLGTREHLIVCINHSALYKNITEDKTWKTCMFLLKELRAAGTWFRLQIHFKSVYYPALDAAGQTPRK